MFAVFHVQNVITKGLDKYAEVIFREFQFMRPKLAARTVFALCGKAAPNDVAEMQKAGFEVFANIADSEMVEFYVASEIYANFSRWEGYNLGIGRLSRLACQWLLPTYRRIALFLIFTSNDTLTIIEKLSGFVEVAIDNHFSGERRPIVWDWQDSLAKLEREIVKLCQRDNAANDPKHERAAFSANQ